MSHSETSPCFVILRHESPPSYKPPHWDLLLSWDTSAELTTWELSGPPLASAEFDARPLPDHRRMYLEYEGPLAPRDGQDRGSVWRVASGWIRGMGREADASTFELETADWSSVLLLRRESAWRWRGRWTETRGELRPRS